jgi:hypothetical protein
MRNFRKFPSAAAAGRGEDANSGETGGRIGGSATLLLVLRIGRRRIGGQSLGEQRIEQPILEAIPAKLVLEVGLLEFLISE